METSFFTKKTKIVTFLLNHIPIFLQPYKKNTNMESYNEYNKMVEDLHTELITWCKSKYTNEEVEYIENAYKVAKTNHAGVARASGEPYITHPLSVALIASKEIGLDATCVACALLHDVVEDTDYTFEEIEKEFGKIARTIVDGLTKIEKADKAYLQQMIRLKVEDPFQYMAENAKKVLTTLADDYRIVIIKIADRLHNLRTIGVKQHDKQIQIASETNYLYVPIAYHLGLHKLKTELEDLCLKATNPVLYKSISEQLNSKKKIREEQVNKYIELLKPDIIGAVEGRSFKIFGRPKHITSIASKMKRQSIDVADINEQIYDLRAVRIVIDCNFNPPSQYDPAKQTNANITQAELTALKEKMAQDYNDYCNNYYELEHRLCWAVFTAIIGRRTYDNKRTRDWLGNRAKSNGYESLHTTINIDGKWVEVQIRSERMDEIAEKGIAAHQKNYKGVTIEKGFEGWLDVIKQQVDKKEAAPELLAEFRNNAEQQQIQVYTPKGKVVTMKKGATVLDFAFEIHTDVGAKYLCAKVSGKLQPMSYKLQDYDQVEIITGKNQKPTENWLNCATTSKARTKIKNLLNNEIRELAEQGKEIAIRKLKNVKNLEYTQPLVNQIASYFHYPSQVEWLADIASEKFQWSDLKKLEFENNTLITPKFNYNPSKQDNNSIENPEREESFTGGLDIFGKLQDNIKYSIATCCNPQPGDSVFGFLSIEKGVTIHKQKCPNAENLNHRFPYRIIKISWHKTEKNPSYLVGLLITGKDQHGIVNKITQIVSEQCKLNMSYISVDAKEDIFIGNIRFFVNNNNQVNQLIKKLQTIDYIHSVKQIDVTQQK